MVRIVNFVKTRPLKSCIFHALCEEMEAEYTALLLHTEVRWLSWGKVLARVYHPKNELKIFLTDEGFNEANLLACDDWCAKLAYMADIFQHLNELNTRMQSQNENLLTSTNKINGFGSKVQLWQQWMKNTVLNMFSLTQKCQRNMNTAALCDTIEKHLKTLQEKLSFYFPSVTTERFD